MLTSDPCYNENHTVVMSAATPPYTYKIEVLPELGVFLVVVRLVDYPNSYQRYMAGDVILENKRVDKVIQVIISLNKMHVHIRFMYRLIM